MSDKPTLSYTDYSFDNLVAQLQNNLAAKSAWKDTYKSATGQMLIELFAGIGSLVLYYIERRAEESYLATAQNYSSVVNLARLLNYTPRRNVSAVTGAYGGLRFSLAAPSTNMVFIPQWTKVTSSSGISYLVSTAGVIMPSQTYVDVPGIQGTLVSVDYTSAGGPSQEYNIADTLVENTNYTVTVNNVTWTEVDSFINSTTTSTHYTLRAELDGTITILFGDGVFGQAPATGAAIKLTYVQSLGLAGNVYTTGLVTTMVSTIYDQAGVKRTVTVTNTDTFLGGDDAETTEDIRANAPKVFATGDRAITKADFVALIGDYPGVADVNVYGENESTPPNYNMFNQVQLCVILQNWFPPPPSFQTTLSTYLYSKSLTTVRYSYVAPVVLQVVPTLIITLAPGVSISYTQSLIESTIQAQFVLGDTVRLGQSVYQSDLIAAVEAVPGVLHCHITLKVQKTLTSSSGSWVASMEALPVIPGTVELWSGTTQVATDNGSGGWTAVSGYTVTGTVDYTTTGAISTTISPAPGSSSAVVVRYRQNQLGDLIVTKNQVCQWNQDIYTSIGY